MLKTFTLKNGIKVATYNLPQLKSVHLRVSIKAGSLNENQGNNGIAHFMEHILVQGIPSFPDVESLSSYIEGLAGTYGAFTGQLIINFNITVPSSHLEDALKIGTEIMFEPLFPEDSIEKERRAILSEISQRRDSHYFKLGEFFRKTRFRVDHPLTLYTGGSPEVVANLKREDLLRFWGSNFSTANAFLIIVGNLNEGKLNKVLVEISKKYPKKSPPKNLTMKQGDFAKGGVFIRADNNLQSVYLDFSFPSMNMTHPIRERLLHNLAVVVLGRLRNSRLFKLLRYKKGLVYDISSNWSSYPGLGYVDISSQTSVENLDEVLTLIVNELKSFMAKGLTEEEIEFAKNFLSNQWLMAFDHPVSISDWIDGELIWEDKVRLSEDYIKMIKKVSPSEVLKLIQKYWDFDKLNLNIQGPIENTVSNIKKYEKMLEDLQ